jgi:hypothetical protein
LFHKEQSAEPITLIMLYEYGQLFIKNSQIPFKDLVTKILYIAVYQHFMLFGTNNVVLSPDPKTDYHGYNNNLLDVKDSVLSARCNN